MKSKLVIEMNEKDDIRIEPKNINIRQLVLATKMLQQYTGVVALAGGTDIDTVKDKLMDVHFAAMDVVTEEAIRRSRSVGNGGH